ncbi:hypothetical protein ACFCX6_01780 [Streptomyces sp. NPDC056353]|uniref:hypothetical protein n=1 Tax=unclassified Streptomyces TaxID=2593676 RepID=UPI0013C865B3|nr:MULTISPECIES: hypothetical protein [unclassified Streptomyces]NDZ71433.1 hypothetical protein [Streptomyces sp. SID10362]QUW95265.1 hypothetical protein KE639_06534 [Streptomyces sp. V17-9]
MAQTTGGTPYGRSVARILRAVPPVSEPAVGPLALAERAGLDERHAPEVEAALALLGVLGVLDLRTGPRGEPLFRAATPIAHGCIRSLAEYLDHGLDVFVNWGRAEAGADAPAGSAAVLSGPRFLFAMESHRFAEYGPSASPLASAEIAQVVIKEGAAPGGESRYLVQYDARSRQYQLVGGHRRPDDAAIGHTIVRELEEELTDFSFDHDSDTLSELQRFERLLVSRTSGVLTHYRIVVFHLRTRRERIVLGPADRWISERELGVGRADDGRRILFSALTELAGGLEGLEPTVPAGAATPRWGLVRRHPWEAMGLLVALFGLAVSILQLL